MLEADLKVKSKVNNIETPSMCVCFAVNMKPNNFQNIGFWIFFLNLCYFGVKMNLKQFNETMF